MLPLQYWLATNFLCILQDNVALNFVNIKITFKIMVSKDTELVKKV